MRMELLWWARRPQSRAARRWLAVIPVLMGLCRPLVAADNTGAKQRLSALALAGEAQLAVLGPGTCESKLAKCYEAIAALSKLAEQKSSPDIESVISDLEWIAGTLSDPRKASSQVLREAMQAVASGESIRAQRIILLSPPELGLSQSGIGQLVIGLAALSRLDATEAEFHLLKAASCAENLTIRGAAVYALINVYQTTGQPEKAAAYGEALVKSSPEIVKIAGIYGHIELAKVPFDDQALEEVRSKAKRALQNQ